MIHRFVAAVDATSSRLKCHQFATRIERVDVTTTSRNDGIDELTTATIDPMSRAADLVLGFDDDEDDEEFWQQAGSALENLTQQRRSATTTTGTGTTTAGNGADGENGDESVEALRQRLIERDARLSVLRSRLDMVERENDNLKRAGTTTTTTSLMPGGNVGGNGGGHRDGSSGGVGTERGGERVIGGDATTASGAANAASVVARAEVQELKQELGKLRSLLAFKEEEMIQARRAEDDSRIKLREANAERTKLAAEVRAERRARATAGMKRPADGAPTSSTRDGEGTTKRQKISSGVVANDATTDGVGRSRNETGSATPSPETLALVLPTAPPSVAATLYQTVVSGYYSNDNAFARLMNDVPLDVSTFLAPPTEFSTVSAELVEPVRCALTSLATNPDSTTPLTRALIETITNTSNNITSAAHYAHLASVLRILSELAMIDARCLSIVLGACGALTSAKVVSVTAHGAPPTSLAGIPGLGGAGMGTLVAHPRGQSGRIFVPATTTTTTTTSRSKTPSKSNKRSSDEDDQRGPAPFLETLIQILSDAKSDGQWLVVDAVLVSLIRFASGVGVECGRGAFGAVAHKHSGFGACLKPIAPSGTRFLALMLTRVLAPTPEFQAFLREPLDAERGVEKPSTTERRKLNTIFTAVLCCLRSDCVEENGLRFGIKAAFVAHITPEQSGTLQEAALRVIATLAFVGWPEYGAAALESAALDVYAAVAVEEYVNPLPVTHSKSNALSYATMLVHALLSSEDYSAHAARLGKRAKSQRVVARLAHLSSATGGVRETRMGDWLNRILLKVRE